MDLLSSFQNFGFNSSFTMTAKGFEVFKFPVTFRALKNKVGGASWTEFFTAVFYILFFSKITILICTNIIVIKFHNSGS